MEVHRHWCIASQSVWSSCWRVALLPECYETPVFLYHICLGPLDSTFADSAESQPGQRNAWMIFLIHRNECHVHSLETVIHCKHIVTW